jgi:hypothetical protein
MSPKSSPSFVSLVLVCIGTSVAACASSNDGTGSSTNDLSGSDQPAHANAEQGPVGPTEVCTQRFFIADCRDAAGVRFECTNKTEVRRFEFVVVDGRVTGVRYSFAGGIDLYAEPPEEILLARVAHPVQAGTIDAAFRGVSEKTKNMYAVDVADVGLTEAAIPTTRAELRVISPSGEVSNPLFQPGQCRLE